MSYRTEHDYLGERQIPQDAFWGIHSQRASENFNLIDYKIDSEFVKAYGLVKLACAKTISELGIWENQKSQAIIQACEEFAEGKFVGEVIVNPLQGGAGTSLNMNVNEVIANRALELLGEQKGNYSIVDPLGDINHFQSTNDTYPTALKIACIKLLRQLQTNVTSLQDSLQAKENEFAHIVKVGRTQLMDAVLTTLGKEFSAYAECISRDRWRIYKCEERLRVVNIGGTAIGTSLGASRKYAFRVIEHLQELTGIGLSRAENLVENTQNTDVFAEVSGILKAHATNLIKISNDLRLLSSGPDTGLCEIILPPVQAGSSIMPGKINPVIPEMVAQAGIKVLGNDVIINHCVASGQLELNQFMPLIAFSMLESLRILVNVNYLYKQKCIDDIQANEDVIKSRLENSQAILTAMIPKLGYNVISEISLSLSNKETVKDFLIKHNYITADEYNLLTSPESVLAPFVK